MFSKWNLSRIIIIKFIRSTLYDIFTADHQQLEHLISKSFHNFISSLML